MKDLPVLIRFGHDIRVECAAPTPMVGLLSVRPERAADLRAGETLVMTPEIPTRTYLDSFGNICRRFVAPAGGLAIWTDGVIEDSGLPDPVEADAEEIPVADLPDDCLLYLMGSRYCDTDRLSQSAWDLFGRTPPGWGRAQAICDFTHERITFGYHHARSTRTAMDTFEERIGVCRDFAHLAIALCRCMGMPARYVNGYLGDIGVPIVGEMDFSAWIEVYLGGRWHTFDPRNNIRRIGRIVVARGRDAADVPLLNTFGPHTLTGFRVWCYEVEGVADPG
jgi:transglutaminase-like putative cysteine protease